MYRLARDEDGVSCTCPDYERRETVCKHVVGLEYQLKREQKAQTLGIERGERRMATNGHVASAVLDKPAPAPTPAPAPAPVPALAKPLIHRLPETNPAPPPAASPASTLYNAAQESESQHSMRLLWDLAQTVEQEPQGLGRKRTDLQKVIYGIIHRVYTAKSGRRSFSDLKVAADIMGLGEIPSRPTLTRYLEDPSLTPILIDLVATSAVPVSTLETGFAADSTAFGTGIRDEQWADAKWGNAASRRAFTGSTWTKPIFWSVSTPTRSQRRS